MSNSSNGRLSRLRRSTKKFGIDDFTSLNNYSNRKSINLSKVISIDLLSNSSEENELKVNNYSDNCLSIKRTLRSNQLINNNENNIEKSDSLKEKKEKKRESEELNDSSSNVSNNERTLRSKETKTSDKTEESFFNNNNKIDLNRKKSLNDSKTETKDLMITKSKRNSLKSKSLKKSINNEIKIKKLIKDKKVETLSKNRKKSSNINGKDMVKIKVNDKKSLDLALKKLHSSSIPESLPCRETQFNDIFNYVESKLIEGIGGCMYISGVPGTGKTATVYEVKRKLESSHKYPSFKFIEINGLRLSDPFEAYVQILFELTGEKRSSYHSADTLNERFSNCNPNNEFVILLVDELDLLRTRKQNILYHLFDWPTRPYSKLIVLAIANAMDLPEKLMINRVSSRLGLTRLSFHPYSYRELEAIISSRLKGLPNVFDSDALQLICRKVAAVSGDARRALDICRRSVEIAQTEDQTSVSMKDVDYALQEIFNSLKLVRIRKATINEQVFLQSIVQEFRISGVEECAFIDVYKHHIEMCRFEGHYTPSIGELSKIAFTLHISKLIILENSNSDLYRRIRLNVSVDDINFALKM